MLTNWLNDRLPLWLFAWLVCWVGWQTDWVDGMTGTCTERVPVIPPIHLVCCTRWPRHQIANHKSHLFSLFNTHSQQMFSHKCDPPHGFESYSSLIFHFSLICFPHVLLCFHKMSLSCNSGM